MVRANPVNKKVQSKSFCLSLWCEHFCYLFPGDGGTLLPSDHSGPSTPLIYNMFSLACLLIFDTYGAPQRHTHTQICSLLHLADCLIVGTFCTRPLVHKHMQTHSSIDVLMKISVQFIDKISLKPVRILHLLLPHLDLFRICPILNIAVRT